ncbi:MAG: succinate dehydrogenase assembly factor 2 [Burkholderiales bacterium]
MSPLDPRDHDRLRWQCRRGMLELDLVLNRFLEHGLPGLDPAGLDAFKKLLALPDTVLLDVVMGRQVLADPGLEAIAERVRTV